MTSKDLEDCSCITWDEPACPARRHHLVSHIIFLSPPWGQHQPEPCLKPLLWRGLEAECSLALALPARASCTSRLCSVSCCFCKLWLGPILPPVRAGLVNQYLHLGTESYLPFSASLWSSNWKEAGENTGLACDHMAMWKFTFLHQKLSIVIQELPKDLIPKRTIQEIHVVAIHWMSLFWYQRQGSSRLFYGKLSLGLSFYPSSFKKM